MSESEQKLHEVFVAVLPVYLAEYLRFELNDMEQAETQAIEDAGRFARKAFSIPLAQ